MKERGKVADVSTRQSVDSQEWPGVSRHTSRLWDRAGPGVRRVAWVRPGRTASPELSRILFINNHPARHGSRDDSGRLCSATTSTHALKQRRAQQLFATRHMLAASHAPLRPKHPHPLYLAASEPEHREGPSPTPRGRRTEHADVTAFEAAYSINGRLGRSGWDSSCPRIQAKKRSVEGSAHSKPKSAPHSVRAIERVGRSTQDVHSGLVAVHNSGQVCWASVGSSPHCA